MELSNWFLAEGQNRNRTKSDFANLFWSLSSDYRSPLNPRFLVNLGCRVNQWNNEVILIRDGLVPLLRFFRLAPEPKGFSGRILVHRDWVDFVPGPWRKVAGTYSLKCLDPQRQKSKCGIFGLVSEFTIEFQDLKDISLLFAGRAPEVLLMYSASHGTEQNHDYFPEFVSRLIQKVGKDCQFRSWQSWKNLEFREYKVLELNNALLCSDSGLLHFALQRGAALGTEALLSKGGELVQLSDHHAHIVHWQIEGQSLWDSPLTRWPPKKRALIERAGYSKVNTKLPWDGWLAGN